MMTTSPIEDPQAVAVSPFPSRTVCYRPARTNMDPVLTLRPYPPANRMTSKRSRAIAGLRIKDWLAAAVPLIKNKLAAGLGAHPVNCGTSDVQRFRAGNRPVFVAKSSTASGPARLFTRFSGRERLPVRIRTVSCNPGEGTGSSVTSTGMPDPRWRNRTQFSAGPSFWRFLMPTSGNGSRRVSGRLTQIIVQISVTEVTGTEPKVRPATPQSRRLPTGAGHDRLNHASVLGLRRGQCTGVLGSAGQGPDIRGALVPATPSQPHGGTRRTSAKRSGCRRPANTSIHSIAVKRAAFRK